MNRMEKKGFRKMRCTNNSFQWGLEEDQVVWVRNLYKTTDGTDVFEVRDLKGHQICSLEYDKDNSYGIEGDFEPVIKEEHEFDWNLFRAIVGVILSLASLLANTAFKNKCSKKVRDALTGASWGWLCGSMLSHFLEKRRKEKYAEIERIGDETCPYEIDPYMDEEE